jgi:hypothetical protein
MVALLLPSLLPGRAIAAGGAAPAPAPRIELLERSYRFLVGDRTAGAGVMYVFGSGELAGRRLPLSFVDSAGYWGEFVCGSSAARCGVVDRYDATDATLAPQSGPAGDLQIERVAVHEGASVYDAATWQIAVMLGAVVNRFPGTSVQGAWDLVAAQNARLSAQRAPTPVRAPTRDGNFLYGGTSVPDVRAAYVFRMLPRTWLVQDPLAVAPWRDWIRVVGPLPRAGGYAPGLISWPDWKPVTGENAWALLIGPLQGALLRARAGAAAGAVARIAVDDPVLRAALALLPTFAAMQTSIGAVRYSAVGPAGLVSVENNASLYAGLRMLDAVLLRALEADAQPLGAAQRDELEAARARIRTLIEGGRRPDGRATAGLLAFFRDRAWRRDGPGQGEFVQGGVASDAGPGRAWQPAESPRAVDANTWTIAALGAARVDGWFGFGAAYAAWQKVKGWGGYGVGRTLYGVGFSDVDGNGMDGQGNYREGVLSAEWTAGAINLVRSLAAHYGRAEIRTAHGADIDRMLASLVRDEESMIVHVQALRYSQYLRSSFPGKPPRYAALVQVSSEPYLYASRRQRVPFGWNANPLPSTCATAWMLMIADRFDPLGLEGRPN